MISENKEDQTAPVSEREVSDAAKTNSSQTKLIIDRILNSLNEKRDAYNGIISSIIYIIDSQNVDMNSALRNGLIESITCRPMRFGGKMFISKAISRLSEERPLFIIELFEQIIEITSVWSKNFEEESEVLRIQIISIKAIRQAEQIKGGRPTKLPQVKIDQLCFDAIFGCDDSTKIDTLSLVLESRSTTKPLSDKELNLFRTLFQDALSLQEPALRQIFLALTNKMIKRVKDSHRVVMRDKKKYSEEERKMVNHEYMQFLTWLTEFCFDSIYCNAYFGSFILTISTLKLIIEHITFTDKELPIETFFNTRRCYDSILSCLNDSFEENKALALELLFSLPYNDKFICEVNLNCFEKIAYQLVGSVNPAHSLTCQYIFRLIVGMRTKQAGSTITKNQLLHHHLSKLVDIVEEGVKEAEEDFVSALKQNAIYPKLTCIRALLNDIDINGIESDREDWTKLAERIVKSSIEACKTVSTIVCNLNPETIGHLPMDLKPVDVDILSKTLKISLKISSSKLNTITSQMLLISGWKTIKECSLSLGAICVRFWWPKERIKMKKEKFPGLKIGPILDSTDIIKIIEFFDHYLRNLRHRGAFEQAYNGFMMVTRRVWHDEHFRGLLVDTLHQILNDFKNDALDDKKVECLKAYVTRRSAGLPFIVQAILNSEHKHDSQTLRLVMDCLFKVLESENSETYQRIHCLNILRALVKEHFLGEKVLSYVGKTFAVIMESFKSDSFPIRNCANMLLKATVDRTFGVNRLRDDIHRRNQLSFERFFTECSSSDLHTKMLKHLKDGLVDRKCLAAVHAVFIILFRLRPSLNPSDDYSYERIIKPFIKPILQLAYQCPDYKLRELAAKLAVRLENFESTCNGSFPGCRQEPSYLNQLKDIIFNESWDRNRLHGALLLTKNWVENDDEHHSIFLSFAQQMVREICLSNRLDVSSSIKSVALDVAESCCMSRPGSDNGWIMDLHPLYKECCLLKETKPQEPHFESLVFKCVTTLLMAAFLNDHMTTINFDGVTGLTESRGINQIIDLMPKIITREANRTFGISLQASLIRFIRQLLSESDNFVDKLLDKLDVDSTAAHMTPFDKLKLRSENDSDREKLVRYCEQKRLKLCLEQSIPVRQIFNLISYKEFQSIEENTLRFSPKFSNTARSIELMAFVCKNWDKFDLETNSTWYKFGENRIDKLNFITQFISDLPDCDIKCLALLCAGKLMASEIKHISSSPELKNCNNIKILENISKVLDELADGDHSLTMRETCSEVLRMNLKEAIEKKCKDLQGCLMNLFSALIKLSQDEEHEVRLSSQRVMLSLRDCASGKKSRNLTVGSRLDHLIKLIATQLFDSNIPQEINNCFELLIRIIFNHSKNYSNDVNEEKERLFDKTKLNTFADHVATIRSSLEGLQIFFDGRPECVNLNSLSFPQDILLELSIVDSPTDDNTGDYSWRLKKVIDGLPSQSLSSSCNQDRLDNNQIVDKFLENVLKSLNYFSNGYWNMLTDTEYTYHELSLYKRIAFIKFVLQCTEHNLKNQHLVIEIRNVMLSIVDSSCSTTLLHKCLNLIA